MARIAVITNFGRALRQMRGHLLHDLVVQGHEVIVCAPREDEKEIESLQRLGISFWRADVDRTGTNPLRDLAYLWRLIWFLRAFRPDKVLAISSKPVIYGGIAARLTGKADCFSMISGLGYVFSGASLHQRLLALPTRWLYRLGLRGNRRVFFQNPDDLALFHQQRMLRSKEQGCVVNGDGVDLEHFVPVPLPGKARFLLIGRLLVDKGIREYAAAAKRVRAINPDARFALVGWFDTNPAAIDQKEVQQWVAEGLIDFAGYSHDVRACISDCDVYVLPSYREGLPRTTVEAMAMGRPIITTDVPGCRETVQNGGNGLLVPVRDSESLADAMLHMLANPAELHRMGAASRRFAEEKFGVRQVNRILLREILGIEPMSWTEVGVHANERGIA